MNWVIEMDCEVLAKARKVLDSTNSTCVFCNGEVIIVDKRRGVRPLLDLLENEANVSKFAVADKVVGKAAAYLYCLLGIGCLYARVISMPALHVLENAGIPVEYDQLVQGIQNRDGNGPCPMESAVWDIENPEEALIAIREKLKQLT